MSESQATRSDTISPPDVAFRAVDDAIKEALKEWGFTRTLKSIRKGRLPRSGMTTVHEGVLEKDPFGRYSAALDTDEGPVVLQNAERTDRSPTDVQSISSLERVPGSSDADSGVIAPSQLLDRLADAGVNAPASLICQVELARFNAKQHTVLLPLLWAYILQHRDSNRREDLGAVGAAIRKYIAIMPMDDMGQLAVLLESGHRSALPTDLEIELAKMIYRNYEVHPPFNPDPQPELANRLWELVQAYTHPRILLRDKHAAIAALAIEAIVAMRSKLADQAWRAAINCPYRWFAELVSDDLDELRKRWGTRSPEAASWLAGLQQGSASLA